jgi:triosephosphate isomerase
MNHTLKSARAFVDEFIKLSALKKEHWVRASQEGKFLAGLFVPALQMSTMKSLIPSDTPLAVGSQNAHWAESGAFTGELSAPMLKEIGVEWVLVGHSERRQYFGETNETVHKRTLSLLKQGLNVVACVGETLSERESNQTEKILTAQIEGLFGNAAALAEFKPHLSRLTVAYEPVWAIGTGKTATPEQANQAHLWIRGILSRTLASISEHEKFADRLSILYGGSVTPENFALLLQQPEIDGGLVGGASIKPDSFFKLIDIALSQKAL